MADNTLTLKFDKETILPLFEGLRGPKGEKGEDGQRGERGEKGEQGVQGPRGEAASAERAAELLKQKNVYLADNSVETVLAKLVELLSDTINVTYKQLEYVQPIQGQEFIDLKGEPHFEVSVDGGEKREFVTDNMRVPIQPFGVANILVKYYDLAGREVGSAEIKGVNVTTNADDTFEENGARYSLFGRKLEIDVTNFTGNNPFKALGKWAVNEINNILVKTSKKVSVITMESSFRDKNNNFIGDIPIIVEKPQNVTFKNRDNISTPVKLGTLQHGVYDVRFSSSQIEWLDSEHKYVSNGDAVDHL